MHRSQSRRIWLEEEDEPFADESCAQDDDANERQASVPPAQAPAHADGPGDRGSVFSFPPPTIPSVAPVAIETAPVVVPRPRVRAKYVLFATLAMGVGAGLLFAAWGAITAPNTASWGAGWKLATAAPQAALAAAPVPTPTSRTIDLEPVEIFAAVPPREEPAPAAKSMLAAKQVVRDAPAATRASVRAAAVASLDSVLQAAKSACREEGMAPVHATVLASFDLEGHVANVEVAVPRAASDVGGCLAVAARKARIDPYEGSPQTVSRSILVR